MIGFFTLFKDNLISEVSNRVKQSNAYKYLLTEDTSETEGDDFDLDQERGDRVRRSSTKFDIELSSSWLGYSYASEVRTALNLMAKEQELENLNQNENIEGLAKKINGKTL